MKRVNPNEKYYSMINRRQFIKATSAGVALLGLTGNAFGETRKTPIPAPGVQLFTFFSVLDNDVEGTLKQVSAAGVRNIESAFSRKGDYYGMKAKDFGALLRSLDMQWQSHHAFGAPFKTTGNSNLPPIKNLKENLNEILDDAVSGGVKYLVAAHLPIGTGDEIKGSLDILNASAAPCRKAGVQLVYHNEPADFKNIEGIVPYEVFLTQTKSADLKFELDIAWAIKGGQDPQALIDRFPGRFPLWHVKDMTNEQVVVPVGEGILDYANLFSLAEKSGLKYYFVEHENPKDGFASLRTSIASIQAIIKK